MRWTGERFWMLETIGEFARERLAASHDADAIGRRHAEWFLALAEEAEPFLKGAEQAVWLQRLEDEHDNLRWGLDWFFDHGDVDAAVRLAGPLWLFWYMHGHVTEARRWFGERSTLPRTNRRRPAPRCSTAPATSPPSRTRTRRRSPCSRPASPARRGSEPPRRPRSPPPSSAPSGPRPPVARPIVGRQWPWARKRSLSRARQATTLCSRSR